LRSMTEVRRIVVVAARGVSEVPIRSNRFQKLVHMIERQLSGHALVRQAVEIPDKETGRPREVDVLIEIDSGHHKLKIGVETITGKADTPWVEGMICKHQHGVLTDKLLLVAGEGFYEPAKAKARLHRVETVELEKAETLDWTKLVGQYAKLWFASVTLSPKKVSLTVEGLPDSASEPGLDVSPKTRVFSADGLRETSLISVVHQSLRNAQVLKTVYDREDRETLSRFDVHGTPAEGCYVLDRQGNPRVVTGFHVWGSLTFSISPFDVETSSYRGAAVGYGSFTIDGKDALATIIEEPGSKPKFSVNLSNSENDPGRIIDLDDDVNGEKACHEN